MFLKGLHYTFVLFCFLLIVNSGISQQRVITGKVIDSRDGSPLNGASVTPRGGGSGTQTEANGSFRLTVGPDVRSIVISSVGFGAKEVSIVGITNIDVQLEFSSTTLGEVVVTGYGTARKKDLTGSISRVTVEDFQKGPQTTPQQLIMGKVAGVQVTTGGGAPGAGVRIRIRQGASLNASNDPLIVIDGVPLETGGIAGVANPLSLLNPNDIESFDILKDASATAIYGNRASNGVIIITTKKGSSGRLKVSYNNTTSLETITKRPDILNPDEFRKLVTSQGTTAQQALLGNSNTDWQKEIYRNAFRSDNSVSFSGGIKKFPYRASIGYLNEAGILKTDNLQRGSYTLNLSPRFFTNHLKVDINLKGSITKSHFANRGAIGAAVFFDPTQPIYDYSKPQYGGYWEWELNGLPNTLAPKNPLSLLYQREDIGNVNGTLANIQFDYKLHFLPDLRINYNLGFGRSRGYGTTVTPATNASAYYNQGSMTRYLQKRWNYLSDIYLNYVKSFPELKSRVDATAGFGYQDWQYYSPSYPTVNGTGTIPAGPPSRSQHTLLSSFARLNYVLDDTYLFTGTFRRDGSSRFADANHWGNFPSAAFAWRISQYGFLRDLKTLSELKLRFGWGKTGQQDVGSDYPYLARYSISDSSGMYQFGSNYYLLLRPEGYDENLKWETSETYNAGIDLALFDNRLTINADYYFKKTKDHFRSCRFKPDKPDPDQCWKY